MKTIYAVSDGEYSDYGILALFSTREKAERYIEKHKEADQYLSNPNIEEYELDSEDAKVFKKVYSIVMDVSTGNVTHKRRNVVFMDEHKKTYCNFSIYETKLVPGLTAGSEISYEHATKVAAEKRLFFLSEIGGSENIDGHFLKDEKKCNFPLPYYYVDGKIE